VQSNTGKFTLYPEVLLNIVNALRSPKLVLALCSCNWVRHSALPQLFLKHYAKSVCVESGKVFSSLLIIFYVWSHLLFSFCMGANSLQQQQEEGEASQGRQELQDRQGLQDRQQLERHEEYGGDRQELDLPRHFR
jgi:hypothetical protein